MADKTVKQLAESYGMTKQAISYHIKKLPNECKNFCTKNGTKILYINEQGQDLLHSLISKKNHLEIANFYTSREYLEIKHKLEIKELENKTLMEKLEFLEKRAVEDKERIDTTLKLLDQAQQLQAMAESKLKALEDRKNENLEPKPKRWFWKK